MDLSRVRRAITARRLVLVAGLAGAGVWACRKKPNAKKKKPERTTTLDEIRTGDLLFFDRREPSLDGLFTHFSHVGVAVVIESVPHIVEVHAADPDRGLTTAGIGLYPLDWRVRKAGASVWVSRCPHDIPGHAIVDALPAYQHVKYPDEYHVHFVASCMFPMPRSDVMICSEFAARLLRDVGVDHRVDPYCLTPDGLLAVYGSTRASLKKIVL